jgi:hypothetical protein
MEIIKNMKNWVVWKIPDRRIAIESRKSMQNRQESIL